MHLLKALFLCLALVACSRQEPSFSGFKGESSGETGSDQASLAPGRTSHVSADSQPQPLPGEQGAHKPVIDRLSFEPTSPVTGDQLRAVVQVSESVGDQAKVVCRWKIDGRVVQESEETALNTPLLRGQFVELEVIAGTGATSSRPVTISAFVGNASPAVRFTGQKIGTDSTYEASVGAVDPEGGPTQFSLKSGPPGMSIDPATGIIRWKIKPEDAGTDHQVQVTAQDSEGAETLLNYQIRTRME